jgi:hypothetical protein
MIKYGSLNFNFYEMCTDVLSKNAYYTIQEVYINMHFLTKRRYIHGWKYAPLHNNCPVVPAIYMGDSDTYSEEEHTYKITGYAPLIIKRNEFRQNVLWILFVRINVNSTNSI